MTKFRPCIDLHEGRVKQIVGGSLRDGSPPQVNFESTRDASWYAELYREDKLKGGHVILLGSGNENSAQSALAAWPGGLQLGGGIHPENAEFWLEAGASHVIVTSWIFDSKQLDMEKLRKLSKVTGPEHLVLDLSCRKVKQGWKVATKRWQTVTETSVNEKLLRELAPFCSEFLVHAADAEGLQAGMDEELLRLLGESSPLPVTYAGGARNITDLERTATLSGNRADLTIGSALDIFGGQGARYRDCVTFNRRQSISGSINA